MSSSLGSGLRSSNALLTSIIAGVQNPHCKPCISLKPCWMGSSWPSCLRPSTVVMLRPSTWTANKVHDFTGVPSSRTVHAPQLLVSQPTCVPVRPNAVRRKWTSSVRGSTSPDRSTPLTVTVTFISSSLRLCVLERLGEAPPREDAHDLTLVLGRSAHVVLGFGGTGGELGRLREQGAARRLAHERLLSHYGLHVVRGDRGERDPGGGDCAVAVEIEVGGHADGRGVAHPALELDVR